MTRALHLRRDRRDGEGLDVVATACNWNNILSPGIQTTTSHVEVTCARCKAAMKRAGVQTAAQNEAPEVLGVERPAVIGERELTPAQARIVERSRGGDDDETACRARFRSWTALHEQHARVLDDGSPVRSTSDPGRFGARAQSSGGAVRMPSGRDDMIEVDLALKRSTMAAMRVGPHDVSGAMQRAVYLARCEGRPLYGPIAKGRKGTITRRAPLSAAQVAERLGEEWTAHHVGMVVRNVRSKMGPMLVAKGILPARVAGPEEQDMKIPGYDLDGWKEIAAVIDESDDTAQRRAKDDDDPLPVTRLPNNRVIAKRAEVEAWALRWAQRGVAPVALVAGG